MTDELNDAILKPYIEMLRNSIRDIIPDIDSWKYVDLPYTLEEYWNDLINMIGERNMAFMAGSKKDGFVRATIFVSPEGLENVGSFLKNKS